MLEDVLIRHAAPTLAGLKTGNLFPCAAYPALAEEVRAYDRLLASKGMRLLSLRHTEVQALLYLYRPARLRRDLAVPEARRLLHEAGYADLRCERCLGELARRLRAFRDFPHEIGLFLSYPPEDVRGFIEHRGRGCKCGGCWKVYGDAGRAQALFRAYRQCTDCYCKRHAMGDPVERLAVAM